jgi:hypothetical protein
MAGQGQEEENEAAEEGPRQERAQTGRHLRQGVGGGTETGHGSHSFKRWSVLIGRSTLPPGSVTRYDRDHKARRLGGADKVNLRGNV